MARSSSFTVPPQQGRTVLITGGNSGLGLASARHLARAGANLVLACRNPVKAEAAAASLRQQFPSVEVSTEVLDLTDLASVRACASRLVESRRTIDVLMNNAGVMAVDKGRTADGFETQLGTNHLGHFALTGLLLPVLAANPDGARIVTVSSMGHRPGVMNVRDPHFDRRRYQRWGAYFQSKLANLLFTAELSRRLVAAGSNVTAVAAHPGSAATELGKVGSAASNALIRRAFGAVIRGADTGAEAQVHAATTPGLAPGSYVGPRWGIAGAPRLETPSRRARNIGDAIALWELSEDATGVTYPV